MNITESKLKEIILEEAALVIQEKKKKKKDKCYKKAKRKFDVFPSRYAGAYIAKCRAGELKEELEYEPTLDDKTLVCEQCLLESMEESHLLEEAKYQGRSVPLGKPMKGDVKKFKVYVKDPKTGNVKKVNFGDKTMRIKKSNPKRRKSFRARHNCANPGPRTKARYWSCRKW